MEVQELKAIVRPLAACLKTEVVKYQFKAYCDMEDYLWIFLPYTEFKTPCPEAISKRIYCMCVCVSETIILLFFIRRSLLLPGFIVCLSVYLVVRSCVHFVLFLVIMVEKALHRSRLSVWICSQAEKGRESIIYVTVDKKGGK